MKTQTYYDRTSTLILTLAALSVAILGLGCSDENSLQAEVNPALTDTHICTPGAVLNENGDPWSNQCFLNDSCEIQGNPCTASDVRIVGAYIADASGNPFPICQGGQVVDGYLWAQF